MRINKTLLLLFFALPLLAKAQEDSVFGVKDLLKLSLEDLMKLNVVTAAGYMQSATEAPSTIVVITDKQIAERGYEHLEDALRDVPGIDMIHINGYAPTLFYFRGMYGAENLRALLMIDGVAENNILGSNDMAGPVYSLHNAERVEIIWGPVSALYGANAFGGVINIITKKGADIDGLHFERGYGSFNTNFQKIHLGLKKSKWEFSSAGTFYNSDGPRFTNRDPNYSGSYVDKAISVNAAISHYQKHSKTTLAYRTYRTPMGWGTYSNSPTAYLGLPAQGNNNTGIIGVLQRDIRGEHSGKIASYLKTTFLEHIYDPNEKLHFNARLIYRQTGIGEESYVYITTDGRKLIRVPIANSSSRIITEINAQYSPSARHHLSAGVLYFRDNVERGSRGITIDLSTIYLLDGRDTLLNLNSTYLKRVYDIRHNAGSYLQYVLNTDMLGKTNFTLGVRYDYNSYFQHALSPRLSIVNQPRKDLTFKVHVGQAFRAPSNLEISQVPAPSTYELTYEKIRTYEFNAIYNPIENLKLQINGFRNELRDVIILGNLSGFTPNKNPGIQKITGAELLTEYFIKNNISAFLNFTYQQTWGKNLVTGNSGKLPGMASVKGNAGITFDVESMFTVSVSGNWVGKRPAQRTNPYGPVKGYFLTNFHIRTQRFFRNLVTASLTVHNLFNVKWLDPGFRTADGNLYSTVLEQPGINGIFKISIDL